MRKQVRANLFLLLFMLLGAQVQAQSPSYGNEWIEPNGNYYKFKVATEGLYRIGKAELSNMGMANVPGSQISILREGKEIPLFVSTNDVFGDSDFIEFWGDKANGKMDTQLYPSPEAQATGAHGMISDTAYYFITYNNNVHLRIESAANVAPSPLPTATPYFWYTSKDSLRPKKNLYGRTATFSDYYYNGIYDYGESYVYESFKTGGVTVFRDARAKYTGTGVTAKLDYSIIGQDLKAHNTKIKGAGNYVVIDTAYGKEGIVKNKVDIPMTMLGTSKAGVQIFDTSRIGVANIEVTYPRTFNYSTFNKYATAMGFDPSASVQYLNITNFSSDGTETILWDTTNMKRYVANVVGTNVKFYLEPSATNRKAFLAPVTEVPTIQDFTPMQFVDFNSMQGDYIILTHGNYINASPSYVSAYKSYRESELGGGHQVVLVDVQQLYDQFGFGYNFHPLGIKHFLKYAYENWAKKPENLFIIGKGLLYNLYLPYSTMTDSFDFESSLVPTYGHPGSDNLFADFNNDNVPELGIGRLSVWNNEEIGMYLDKVKAYEAALKIPAIPTPENTLWKKTALHIAGGNNPSQQNVLLSYLNTSKNIYMDTLIGGQVITVAKNTSDPVSTIEDAQIDSAINHGIGTISFFGHGSSTGFDVNLNDPDEYNSNPRFPTFSGFGCSVSAIFNYNRTVGEHYINSINGGSITMLSTVNDGYISALGEYLTTMYKKMCYANYGQTLGHQLVATALSMGNSEMVNIHKQCMLLQGDPGLNKYSPSLHDYYTDETLISTNPFPVTTAMDSFKLNAKIYSLGMSTHDSVLVVLEKTKSGNNTVLYADSVRVPILLSDTVTFTIPVNRITDVGLNLYTIKINPSAEIPEVTMQNNNATLQLFIADNGLEPIYPYNFSIVYNQGVTLKASALNLFGGAINYLMEIDTAETFTSPNKLSTTINSIGGVIQWTPPLKMKDSVVYYWRTASDQLINGEIQWRNSSFIYLKNGSDGWNQSHYYQYKHDEPFFGVRLPADKRKFEFSPFTNTLKVKNRIITPDHREYLNVSQSLNDVFLDRVGCDHTGTIQIVVFDSLTGMPWANPPAGVAGSIPQCNVNLFQFEFLLSNAESRNNARLFLDSIPQNNYVLIKNYINKDPAALWGHHTIDEWMTDSTIYGSGNTLYDKIKELGFDKIDSFTSTRTFIFFRKKGDNSYPVSQVVSQDSTDIISLNTTFLSYPDTGRVTSTLIGPALKWETLKWRTSGSNSQNDYPFVSVFGINNQNEEVSLFNTENRDTSLNDINANTYKYLKLVWNTADTINKTSAHLDFWRVLYQPLPEAALNPIAKFELHADSLIQGEKGSLKLAIENLTPYPMDSMLVRYRLIDKNNVQHEILSKKYKKLIGNDTLIADLEFNPAQFLGKNTLFVEANPDNNQPEQYHPNNLGYIPFTVVGDNANPLLDVTFDGIHILDKDIVSAKPFIKATMVDENKYSALADTSLLKVQLAYPPDQTRVETINFDGSICKFIPADLDNGKKNEATIEFNPTLKEDGLYKLIISGKDVAGNIAGSAPTYEINFMVENKPTISNVLNYPNPFSTQTAFLFTMTGYQIPSQFKIQIMTVTGKIVREITKAELGPLHIGRNITEYKWDGRDQYGQLLGNGVYLYRVVTSLEGNSIEHRTNAEVDQFFKKNFGKMYIMR